MQEVIKAKNEAKKTSRKHWSGRREHGKQLNAGKQGSEESCNNGQRVVNRTDEA